MLDSRINSSVFSCVCVEVKPEKSSVLLSRLLILEVFFQTDQFQKDDDEETMLIIVMKRERPSLQITQMTAVIPFSFGSVMYLDLNHTLPPLLFPPVPSSTKAPPHLSTSRACRPTATTVSACALSDSARTLPS